MFNPLGQFYGHLCQHNGILISFLPFVCQVQSDGNVVAKIC
jgi:hypothetical protein